VDKGAAEEHMTADGAATFAPWPERSAMEICGDIEAREPLYRQAA